MIPYVQPAALRAASIDLTPYLPTVYYDESELPGLVVLDVTNVAKRSLIPDQAALERARQVREAIGLGDVPFMTLNPDMAMSYNLPRGIPWTAFPILSDARFKFEKSDKNAIPVAWLSPEGKARFHYNISLEVALKSVSIVAILGDDSFNLHLSRVFLERYADLDRVSLFRSLPGREVERLDRDYLEALGARGSLDSRFHYSYAINAHAIGAKALAPFLAVSSVDEDALKRRGFKPYDAKFDKAPKRAHKELLEATGLFQWPATLQILYALGRKGDIPWTLPRDIYWDVTPTGYRELAPACACLFRVRDKDVYLWTGTGKHEPKEISTNWLGYLMSRLIFAGFVEFHPNKDAVRLADSGRAFLAALPKDCEDPDVLCRWKGIEPEKSGPAMDAWQIRFFRKMKTTVNRMGVRDEAPG